MSLRILVVDDNEINARLLQLSLGADGHVVRVAGTAAEARAAISEFDAGLFLLDVHLPGGDDGLTLCRELRRSVAHQKTPIIAITAFAMKGDEERALLAGCTRHLSKPIDVDALSAIIRDLSGATP